MIISWPRVFGAAYFYRTMSQEMSSHRVLLAHWVCRVSVFAPAGSCYPVLLMLSLEGLLFSLCRHLLWRTDCNLGAGLRLLSLLVDQLVS